MPALYTSASVTAKLSTEAINCVSAVRNASTAAFRLASAVAVASREAL
jgi:hypothetical protein